MNTEIDFVPTDWLKVEKKVFLVLLLGETTAMGGGGWNPVTFPFDLGHGDGAFGWIVDYSLTYSRH